MKRCPTCQLTYTDDAPPACPHDGARLVAEQGIGEVPAPSPAPGKRDKLFISYSHQDRAWLEKLQLNLRPYFRQNEASILAWDDRQIRPGAKWFDEIDHALASACVAVLLVTPDFLASEFINDVELPHLLRAAQTEGLQILWIAVRASAVAATEISHYQGLNNPAEPLANLSEAAQDAKLVEICKKIKHALQPPALPSPPAPAATSDAGSAAKPLALLHSFETYMADIGPCIAHVAGQLWVANAQQAKVFVIGQEQPTQTWLLPRRRWKQHLNDIWREHLVISDWRGALYQLNAQTGAQEQLLHQARPDDLPMHLLTKGADGALLTAAWNGLIRAWAADGQPRDFAAPIAVPHLPQHLLALPQSGVAVVDQANRLHVYDATGQETETRSCDESVQRLWLAADDASGATFIAQAGERRLVKWSAGKRQIESVAFAEPIVSLAHGRGRAEEEWVLVARAGGKVDWLPTMLFSVVRDNSVTLPCEVKQLHVIHDARQPASLLALGLSVTGQLFTLNEREVTLYAAPRPVEQLVLDQTGHFLFLRAGTQVMVCRNPAMRPARLRAELAEPVQGQLVVDGFKRITVQLKNTGDVAIHQIRADLSAAGIIESSSNTQPPPRPLAPGETMALQFSVRAKVLGDLPLGLRLELEDEGGPPVSVVELRFNLESTAAG